MTTVVFIDLIRRELQSELGPDYQLSVDLPWEGKSAYYTVVVGNREGAYARVLYDEAGRAFGVEGPPRNVCVTVVEIDDPKMFEKLAEAIRCCKRGLSTMPSLTDWSKKYGPVTTPP